MSVSSIHLVSPTDPRHSGAGAVDAGCILGARQSGSRGVRLQSPGQGAGTGPVRGGESPSGLFCCCFSRSIPDGWSPAADGGGPLSNRLAGGRRPGRGVRKTSPSGDDRTNRTSAPSARCGAPASPMPERVPSARVVSGPHRTSRRPSPPGDDRTSRVPPGPRGCWRWHVDCAAGWRPSHARTAAHHPPAGPGCYRGSPGPFARCLAVPAVPAVQAAPPPPSPVRRAGPPRGFGWR